MKAATKSEQKGDEASTEATDDDKIEYDEKHWENNKKVGPLLLRVQIESKESGKDVKVWYKISSKSGNADNINVVLPETRRKVHLTAGHKKLCESLRIKDPSKGYFFKDINDIKIDLEVTVVRDRAAAATGGFQRTGGGKTVQISEQVESNYYGHDEDDDIDYGLGGDDAARYAAFQTYESGNTGGNAAYTVTTFDTQALENVLALNMGGLEPQDGDGRKGSNSSTDAVMLNNDIAGEIGDVGGQETNTDPAVCPNCSKPVSLTDDSCPSCMTWLGNM